jgi:hypothetical protein
MAVPAIRCKDYPQLLQALDARRRQLGMTMLDVDCKSGLQNGYSSKLLVGIRKFGLLSLPLMLQTLGVELLVAPRDSEPARPEARTGSAGHVQHLRPTNGDTP